MTDQWKEKNQRKCGANRQLIFRGAVAKDEVDNLTGKDVVHLILLFSDELSFRLFDPRISVGKKNAIAATLGSLCEALGIDWNDVPACFGWEDFTTTMVDFLEPHKRKQVYAKVTLNKSFWPTYGTDRCFSAHPDMSYSDADLTYLDNAEGDLAHPSEGTSGTTDNGGYDDLPF